jgi:hypothetical protein
MPRPWIPRVYLQPSLPEAPQLKSISRKVNLGPAEVVSALKVFWLEAQARCLDGGRLHRKTPAWVDMMTGVDGLAAAMIEVDWLRVDGGDLLVPGFDAWISKAAVKRIENAEAQRVRRAARAGSTGDEGKRGATLGYVELPGPTREEQPAKAKKPRKPRAVKAEVKDPNFWRFWKAYPKQWNQVAASEAWHTLAPDAALVEVILAAIDKFKRSVQWTKRGPNGEDFIPSPVNFLAGRRWEDRIDSAPGPGGTAPGSTRLRSGEGEYGKRSKFTSEEAPPGPGSGPSLF